MLTYFIIPMLIMIHCRSERYTGSGSYIGGQIFFKEYFDIFVTAIFPSNANFLHPPKVSIFIANLGCCDARHQTVNLINQQNIYPQLFCSVNFYRIDRNWFSIIHERIWWGQSTEVVEGLAHTTNYMCGLKEWVPCKLAFVLFCINNPMIAVVYAVRQAGAGMWKSMWMWWKGSESGVNYKGEFSFFLAIFFLSRGKNY